jgi:hypothetical protein
MPLAHTKGPDPEVPDDSKDSSAMRSLDIKRATQVLEFLSGWPLRYVVTISLAMVCVGTIAAMIPRSGKVMVQGPATNSIAPTSILALAQHIADSHLFGQEPGQAPGAAAIATAVAIKVQGLLYSDDQTAALAILEVNGNSGTFKVGDVLADGEKLTAISPTAVQLTQGMTQRAVEMPQQFGGPEDGIALSGATGLGPNGDQLPGFTSPSGMPTYQPTLHTVSVPDTDNPLDQLRSLRQQLIAQRPETAPSDSMKHPAKP